MTDQHNQAKTRPESTESLRKTIEMYLSKLAITLLRSTVLLPAQALPQLTSDRQIREGTGKRNPEGEVQVLL